jgi:hypothetical protein
LYVEGFGDEVIVVADAAGLTIWESALLVLDEKRGSPI